MQEEQNFLDNQTDEQIILLIKQGDDQALTYLLNKYKNLVNIKVSKFFIIGAEKDDVLQEGMIGLLKAIKNFNAEKQSSFKTFANICIERHLISYVKSSNRQKHIPLNSYLSLNTSAYENDEESVELIDKFNSQLIEDPVETLIKREYMDEINSTMERTLSDFEKNVLNQVVIGKSYVDIANSLEAPVKSVDNAIQRIRKKAIKNMFNNDSM